MESKEAYEKRRYVGKCPNCKDGLSDEDIVPMQIGSDKLCFVCSKCRCIIGIEVVR